MDPIQTAISEIASLPDLHPETKTLLALAAEAQRTGKMPEIPGGRHLLQKIRFVAYQPAEVREAIEKAGAEAVVNSQAQPRAASS